MLLRREEHLFFATLLYYLRFYASNLFFWKIDLDPSPLKISGIFGQTEDESSINDNAFWIQVAILVFFFFLEDIEVLETQLLLLGKRKYIFDVLCISFQVSENNSLYLERTSNDQEW